MKYRSKPTDCEVMQWNGSTKWSNSRGESSSSVITWVNSNGGEARYEPPDFGDDRQSYPATIAVRTINGWAYAAPGHYVVMGSAEFCAKCGIADCHAIPVRDFYPVDAETFASRWESVQ